MRRPLAPQQKPSRAETKQKQKWSRGERGARLCAYWTRRDTRTCRVARRAAGACCATRRRCGRTSSVILIAPSRTTRWRRRFRVAFARLTCARGTRRSSIATEAAALGHIRTRVQSGAPIASAGITLNCFRICFGGRSPRVQFLRTPTRHVLRSPRPSSSSSSSRPPERESKFSPVSSALIVSRVSSSRAFLSSRGSSFLFFFGSFL